MTKRKPNRPTDAELSILRVLWSAGPSPVRRVHEALGGDEVLGYTSVLKTLQIMNEKGLVERNEERRSHVYRTALTREQTQRQLVRDLLDRAFGGSAPNLVMQALAAKPASAEERAAIRELLDEMEGADS